MDNQIETKRPRVKKLVSSDQRVPFSVEYPKRYVHAEQLYTSAVSFRPRNNLAGSSYLQISRLELGKWAINGEVNAQRIVNGEFSVNDYIRHLLSNNPVVDKSSLVMLDDDENRVKVGDTPYLASQVLFRYRIRFETLYGREFFFLTDAKALWKIGAYGYRSRIALHNAVVGPLLLMIRSFSLLNNSSY